MTQTIEDQDKDLTFDIKVINNLTGEVSTIKVGSATKAAEVRQELKASEAAIKKALKQIDAHLDNWLGDDQESPLPNGMVIKRVHRYRTEWSYEILRKYLDEDQITLVTTVKKTQAKEMLSELVAAGHIDNGVFKDLEENAIPLPSTPFLEVK